MIAQLAYVYSVFLQNRIMSQKKNPDFITSYQ